MPAFKTFSIGSGKNCDIRLNQSSIDNIHAELVIARNGDLHLTDRASKNGTFRKNGARWVRLKQDYILPTEPLRFGDYHVSVSTLMQVIAASGADAQIAAGAINGNASNQKGAAAYDPKSALPTGRVRRSVDTGEIIAMEKE